MARKLTPWQKLVKQMMAQHKGKPFGEILKLAKSKYKK